MIFSFEERPSDSPWVQCVWRTRAQRAGSFLSIAASQWEVVVSRYRGQTTLTVRGPETTATPVACHWEDAEFFGIVFQLGTFMPALPPGRLMQVRDVNLDGAGSGSFWLHGSAWPYPDYDNADAFVDRLVRRGLLAHEPMVEAALGGQLQAASLRTRQRQFLRATGLTLSTVRQIERARHATTLLRQGVSIPDTVYEAGYFDQAHLTRSLARFIGQTPTRVADRSRPTQLSLLYKTAPLLPRYALRSDIERQLEAVDAEDQAGYVRLARRGGGEPSLD